MDVNFTDCELPPECYGEIDDVLQRLEMVNRTGELSSLPQEIRILRRLAGGRSGAEVLDAMFKNGDHEASKVIKLGPIHELENEFHAFQQYLSSQYLRHLVGGFHMVNTPKFSDLGYDLINKNVLRRFRKQF